MDHYSGSTTAPPLLAAVQSVDMELKQVRDIDPTFLALPEKQQLLLDLVSVRDQVEGLIIETLAASADVADAEGFRTAGGWLASHTQQERSATSQLQHLADDAIRYPLLRDGLRDGRVSVRQATAITQALDALGRDVSPAIKTEAEARMVAFAAEFDAAELRKLGKAVLETIDPDTFEDHERQRLEDELRKAYEATRLSLRQRGDGTTRISGVIPDSLAARLKTCLSAFSSPRHDAATNNTGSADTATEPVEDSRYLDPVTGKRLPGDRVLGEALCAFIEAADPTRIPMQGGAATTIIVTMDLEKLRAGIGAGTMAGERIPASEVRRLACQAGIIPAVLGGKSEVLDLGRTRRLHSPAQRKAIAIRHRTCIVEGCTVPVEQCEIHHRRPWSQGGSTDLNDGVPGCPRHHHLFHDEHYEMTWTTQGEVRLHRRC
jgi:hypothetical protein